MAVKNKKQLIQIKKKYKNYIASNQDNIMLAQYRIQARLRNLEKNMNYFLKKENISQNKKKLYPKISKLLFGLSEDFKRLGLEILDFDLEKKCLNQDLIGYIDSILKNRKWYGQALLECYLEIYFNFTILKCSKKLEYRPVFLINPTTEQALEYDIFYCDFGIGFEFQGEYHYIDDKQKNRDKLKIDLSLEKNKTIIHVNASQLDHKKLSELISNILIKNSNTKNKKIIQRLFASTLIFDDALLYLDSKSKDYLNNTKNKYPNTSSKEALCVYQKENNTLSKNYALIPKIKNPTEL